MNTRPPIVLVCGGRDYRDVAVVTRVLDAIAASSPGFAVLEGGAPGADTIARNWAHAHGHACFTCEAAWNYYSKRAGGVRNGWMATFVRPDYVVHFPGGTGTADMVCRATELGIPCYAGAPVSA